MARCAVRVRNIYAFMKTRISKLIRFLFLLFLAVCAVTPPASAQPRPTLGLQFSAGRPTLSLSGQAGTVYSIQYATGLSPTNLWVDRTLLQAQAGSNDWTDPSVPTRGQRFYRAVSVPAPADTNLVFIQPGTFTMGSPTNEAERDSDEVEHVVTISRGFWMGKFLVTQGDYLAVVGSNPSYFTSANGYPDDPTRPVETVSFRGGCDQLLRFADAAGADGGADSHELCVSAADGIGVGVRGPGGHDDGVLFGEWLILGTGELQWPIRIQFLGGHEQ